MVLNKSKFKFAHEQTNFAGFQVGKGEIKPLDEHVEAIRNFPIPGTLTDLRSFFAMAEQVAYAFPIKEPLFTFRELLKKGRKFYWDEQLTSQFKWCRETIANSVVDGIKTYDYLKPTTLETDWSCDGMGYWMRQKHCNCPELTDFKCCSSGWRLAMCGSRFCTGAESRYAPVEGELAAVAWALEKTKLFTLGARELYIVTDHKPLISIIKGSEKAANVRLMRLREKLTTFSIADVWYREGKENSGPDALSRHAQGVLARESDGTPSQVLLLSRREVKKMTYRDVQTATAADETIKTLEHLILNNFKIMNKDNVQVKQVWSEYNRFKNDLHVNEDRIIYYKNRFVLPTALREWALQILHIGHQGVYGMNLFAEKNFFLAKYY